MTIQEQAQQLAAVAEQVPQGAPQELLAQLDGVYQECAEILGEIGGLQEIGQVIEQAKQQVSGVGETLGQVREAIAQRAAYHLQA